MRVIRSLAAADRTARGTGGAVHGDVVESGYLQQRGTDTAGCPQDQDRPARLHLGDVVQHLPGRDVVQDQGVKQRRVHIGADRDQVRGVEHDVGGVPARADQRRNPLPHLHRADLPTRRDDFADQVEPQHPWQPTGAAALPGGDVVERDPGRFHPHQDLCRARHRYRLLSHRELLRAPGLVELNLGHHRGTVHPLNIHE